jgi:O-antigen/teichoic acid export membrane protein
LSKIYLRLKSSLSDLLTSDSVKGKVARGGAWLTAGSVTEQAFRFGRSMILARLLAPEAFGTMAVIISATSVIHSITDIGVSTALIQHPHGTEEEYKSAAWWLAFSKSCSLYLFFFIMAPLLARFYGNPELCPLLRVATVGILFDGAFSSNSYIAQKKMEFKKWALLNNGGGILGVVLTVVLSFFIRDVWALVIGSVGESVARFSLSYIVCPYMPRFLWNRQAFRDLLQFSRGLFGLSFLNLIFARTDVFVLAKLFSPADLGLYVMAVYLVQTPGNYVIGVLNQILLPAFSHVQHDKPRMNRILLQVFSVSALLGLPAFVFAASSGRSLLTVVFSSRYSAASGALIAASLVMLLNIFNAEITLVFYGLGIPQLHRRSVMIMAIMMIVLIYPFVKWFGLVGGQLAGLAAITTGYAFQLERAHRLIDLSLREYQKVLLPATMISLVAIGICAAARFFPGLQTPIRNLGVGVFACLAAYCVGAVYFLRAKPKAYAAGESVGAQI